MSAVLIVEDEKHLADGLRFNLEAEGYMVEAVGDGESALVLLTENPQKFGSVRSHLDADGARASGRCAARV
jgi:DNA-binding response OmpR family regulator